MPKNAVKYLNNHQSEAVDRLQQFLTIQSVSTDPAFSQEVRRGAKWVARELNKIGMEVTVYDTAGHPVVLAKTPNQLLAPGAAEAPHVLFYGHYDVQPPDPIDLWTTPPFLPEVRDGAIYARGASDDKGQVCCFLEALRAWTQNNGKLPVPVTVLIEGEEECGSVNLQPFIKKHKENLAADIVVISDTSMWDDQTVTITYGLRGLLYFDVQLHGPSRDLHSGVYGGVLANPATMITRIIGKLFDSENRITIPGFYDDVATLSDQEAAQWEALDFDEHKDCLGPVGVDTPFGEEGYSTLQRRWARPSCDINGIYGGYMGEGAKTVIPSFAGAKVSFRLALNQNANKIAKAFEGWLHLHDTGGCEWKITNHGAADPVGVSSDSPFVAAAQRAIKQSSGKAAVLAKEGATIPVVADFKNVLGLDSLLIGFGLNSDCIHSPDEHFALDRFNLGCRTHALLLSELAKGG